MFGERANALTTHTTKGKRLLVSGNLEIINYEDSKTKEKKQWTLVNIEQYDIIEWATEKPNADTGFGAKDENWQIPDGGDIPF